MKKLIAILLLVLPVVTFGQYLQIPRTYPSDRISNEIVRGNLKMHLKDTVKVTIEKKKERYITDCGISPEKAKVKVDNVFSKGKPEFTSRTNGGYIFTICVMSREDETKIINYVTFHVDEITQKIEEIEILLGE